MAHSSQSQAKILVFLATLTLSALTMIWLFWRYPLSTSIAAVAVLAALYGSARLARSVETDSEDTMDEGEHST
jgi:hypothetical protein